MDWPEIRGGAPVFSGLRRRIVPRLPGRAANSLWKARGCGTLKNGADRMKFHLESGAAPRTMGTTRFIELSKKRFMRGSQIFSRPTCTADDNGIT
jgi:hypothetical protein